MFPEDMVKEVKDLACRQKKPLLKKWSFPEKGEKCKEVRVSVCE